ncbi:MAG: DUF134 domain-containing protein [Prolixibacteraceae bacterium]|nr:DUF134 domain-containing protein [Prolixibacteraceae bacterium]MBN2772689.1 DUF134 domain-containing protein [Prolixibacteraceae bacterium]
MPRRKRGRKMLVPPVIKGMSVFGVRGRRAQEVYLLFEEYEAIRLLDYRGMNQEEAAVHMEVSRPTLTRIYEDARRKVAKAFVEGRDILIRGGDFFFEDNWFKCNSCKASFSSYEEGVKKCPVCDSDDTESLNEHYKNQKT